MPKSLSDLRAEVEAAEQKAAETEQSERAEFEQWRQWKQEQSEREQLETRLAELNGRRPALNTQSNGIPLPPSNQTEAMQSGSEAELARARALIRRPGDTKHIAKQMSLDELQDVEVMMWNDALKRHQQNHVAGRGDLGSGPASFYR